MADDDDQGTSSGSRPKLLLPKAPGPAQPLSHVASRHRKKLDAALSAGGYYDVAHGRESARAQRIQVIDLSLHPGMTALQVSALPPDRQYRYQIERAQLELTVNKAMQKKFDLIMAERTVVCEAIAASNDDSNPVLAKRIREDCNYTASMGIAGGYYDGPLAYQLQIKFLIPDVRSEHDKNFYENAWKVHKEQGSLKDFCFASDFEALVDCFIELMQPYRASPLQAQEAMEHIINLMPSMYSTEKWMFKESAIKDGWYVDLVRKGTPFPDPWIQRPDWTKVVSNLI